MIARSLAGWACYVAVGIGVVGGEDCKCAAAKRTNETSSEVGARIASWARQERRKRATHDPRPTSPLVRRNMPQLPRRWLNLYPFPL